jgi:membrane fusion protein (multidrug efflux system)
MKRPLLVLVYCAPLVAVAACGRQQPPAPPEPVAVRVLPVIQRTTEIASEYVGEIRGSEEVEVRARASGIMLEKLFRDGSVVRKGEELFRLDDRESQSQLVNARAQAAEAEAALSRAREDVARYEPLVQANAISRQMYDNAVAGARQAEARVEAAKAVVAGAGLGIEYAVVRAPISGTIGEALIQPGGLVAAGSTLLAKISKSDPAFVYFNVPEQQLLEFSRLPEPEQSARIRAMNGRIRLTLGDGVAYDQGGHIDFGARAIDPKTGTYTLRASFPNPRGLLRPGLYGKIRMVTGVIENALLVPDRAVTEQLGKSFVSVVGPEGKVLVKPVTLGPRIGGLWVVTSGLAGGESVIVEGALKAPAGAAVKALPVTEAELAGAPAAPAMQ